VVDDGDLLAASDRRTLAFWRVSNIVGWIVVALVASYVLQTLIANVRTIVDSVVDDYRLADTLELWLGVISAVLAGAAIGSIIGRRVYRSAPAYAGIATALAAVPFHAIQPHHASQEGILLQRLLTIGVAIAVAVWAGKRRPLALRGGRGVSLPE